MELGEKDFVEMMTMFRGFSGFQQRAAKWALCHWNLVEDICKHEPPYSDEEMKMEIQKAVETKDYAYYALLMYLRMISVCE